LTEGADHWKNTHSTSFIICDIGGASTSSTSPLAETKRKKSKKGIGKHRRNLSTQSSRGKKRKKRFFFHGKRKSKERAHRKRREMNSKRAKNKLEETQKISIGTKMQRNAQSRLTLDKWKTSRVRAPGEEKKKPGRIEKQQGMAGTRGLGNRGGKRACAVGRWLRDFLGLEKKTTPIREGGKNL